MSTFTGSITTTGKSEAIRLDKALFRLHPEFRQKAKVRAQVIAPGHALISVVEEGAPAITPRQNFSTPIGLDSGRDPAGSERCRISAWQHAWFRISPLAPIPALLPIQQRSQSHCLRMGER